jgi:hypothetical protein
MLTRHIGLLVALALVAAAVAGPVQAQPPGLPPAPVPVQQPPGPVNGIAPIAVPGQPAQPYVPSEPIFLDRGPGLLPPQPPSEPRLAQPGLYGILEIQLLYPQLHGWLNGSVGVLGGTDSVSLRSACLETTGSPKFEVGWRLTEGMGAVAVSYRSIVSEGHANVLNWDALGSGFETSRLNVNVVDLDYVSPAYNFAPYWDLSWRGGLRFAAAYFDHEVDGAFAEQRASSNFLGAGPHAAIEVGRAFERCPGLGVTSKLDFAVLIGDVSQHFDETLNFGDSGLVGGAGHASTTQVVPVLTYSIGLTYTPPRCAQWARFGLGYQFEYWWDVGTAGQSHGDMSTNGVYFRGEFNY